MKILVCPLNWGIGHGTRCVPLIQKFISENHEVVIGANGRTLAFLKGEFPNLEALEVPGYDIQYPTSKVFFMFLFLPRVIGFLFSIPKEQKFLDALVLEKGIDKVISDNRFGLHTKRCPCIFMTHQLYIKIPALPLSLLNKLIQPLFQKALNYLVKKQLNKFTQVWIPDFEGDPNLAGDLCHPKPMGVNCVYLGSQSRFTGLSIKKVEGRIDYLAVISGPEPQRTYFEKKVLQSFEKLKGTRVIVSGKPELYAGQQKVIQGTLNHFPHLPSTVLVQYLKMGKVIVCRPGYSSVMDFVALKKNKVLFVPTPGQTEQEYLARKYEEEKIAPWMEQEQFSIDENIFKNKEYVGFGVFKGAR